MLVTDSWCDVNTLKDKEFVACIEWVPTLQMCMYYYNGDCVLYICNLVNISKRQ